jgi:SAM-dependent methyltransferase
MTNHDQYFSYLMHRSRLGELYRKYWLYPRLSRHLVGTALDIGCGIGDMLAFRPGTVGVDVNARTVEYCSQRGFDAHLMQPDILPFQAGAFDSALLDNVLEHIAEPDRLLEEVYRVVTPGGRLVIGVPGIFGWKSDLDHKVFYDEKTLRECVEKHNFVLAKTFHSPLWRSSWLASRLRQYCVYSVFQRAV